MQQFSFMRTKQCHELTLIFSYRDGASLCGVFCAVFNCIQKIHMDDSVDVFRTVRQLQIRRPEFCSTQVRFDGNNKEMNTQNSISQSHASIIYLMTNSSITKSKCRFNAEKWFNRKYCYICKGWLSGFFLECKPTLYQFQSKRARTTNGKIGPVPCQNC